MKKRIYKLKDIEKILTFTPPFFIFLLAITVFVVGIIVLGLREKSKITLITQKAELEKNFIYKNKLNEYIQNANDELSEDLGEIELSLKKEVHILKGLSQGISQNKPLHVNDIIPHIKKTELNNNIQFVIFDKNYNILYGKESICKIQNLIFNQIKNTTLFRITLMYIASQGNLSSFRWKNDTKKTIQLSYFEKYDNNDWYIGVFSSIDSLKKLTKNILLEHIKEHSFKDFYVWVYDDDEKLVYNFENLKKWQIQPKPSSELLQYYYDKYFLSVGLTPILLKDSSFKNQIAKEYADKKVLFLIIVIITTSLLIFFTTIFSTFIKKIFSTYNKRLENKNKLLTTLKERFELAVIASNDGLWDTNFNTNKTFFSKKWLNILGYDKKDITSYEQWFDLIHKDDKSIVNQALNEHISDDSIEHLICEYRLRTKDNRYKWVLARGKVFLNEDLTPKRLLMMTMDIDERKRVAKDLKDTELLVSDGGIAVLRLKNSDDLSVQFISNSIKMYGYTPNDFINNTLNYIDIIHQDDIDEFIASLHAYINQGFDNFSKSYRIITKSGNIRWVLNRILFIKDDFGNITNLYGYIYDITPLKQSEEQLSLLVQKEVEKNEKKQKLLIQQNKLAAMGEMIGSIAHQWRQPLNNISLILYFIKDNFKTLPHEMIEKYVDNAKEQLEYMSDTINDFRDFYKPSKNKEPFNIAKAINSAIDIMRSQIEKNNIHVKLHGDEFEINGYENEFKQAILNILANAKDAISNEKAKNPTLQGVISINISKNTITIFNNGGNASKEVLERMFEPYYTTKFENKGTGIGLYMTKTIIETSMNGEITVQNLDDGVLFNIVI